MPALSVKDQKTSQRVHCVDRSCRNMASDSVHALQIQAYQARQSVSVRKRTIRKRRPSCATERPLLETLGAAVLPYEGPRARPDDIVRTGMEIIARNERVAAHAVDANRAVTERIPTTVARHCGTPTYTPGAIGRPCG